MFIQHPNYCILDQIISFSHQSESDKEELEDVGVGDGDHSADQSVADGDGGADDDRRCVVDLKDDLQNKHYLQILCISYYILLYTAFSGLNILTQKSFCCDTPGA